MNGLSCSRLGVFGMELDVPIGKWRHLTKKELKEINRLGADSSKTYKVSLKNSSDDFVDIEHFSHPMSDTLIQKPITSGHVYDLFTML